ncbi:uncharacterized protein LOC122160563 isoform X2 [Centrocercus urophasianus]|uniref:uncharacterized protein LOC122160563 isoform X2 n=1 Tax=Centrocercus urophasianus TaxID=9002 RepID=UPI001C652F4E|nr:uncharacterized protein LOC122160563 isoform X2 [Centrocercus urophasianus]
MHAPDCHGSRSFVPDHRMLHRSRLQSSLPIITSRENEVKGSKTSAAVLRHDWLLQAVTDKDSTWQGGELSKSHSRAEQGILASPTRPDLEEQTEVLQSTGQWGGNISLCPAQFTADQRKEFFTLLSFCWSKTIRITDGFLARCSLAGRQFGVYKRFNENLAFSQLLANTLGLSSHTSKLRS